MAKKNKHKNLENEYFDVFRESLATVDAPVINEHTDAKMGVSIMMGVVGLALAFSAISPVLAPNNYVWGLFEVNAAHTAIHFAAGLSAIYAAFNLRHAVLIWRGAAILFGLLTVLGLIAGDRAIFGLVANNSHDVWLHAVKTAVFAWLGWSRHEL